MLKELIESTKKVWEVEAPKKLKVLDYIAIACLGISIGTLIAGDKSASLGLAGLSLAAMEGSGNAAAIDFALLFFAAGFVTAATSMVGNTRFYVGEIARGYKSLTNAIQNNVVIRRENNLEGKSQSRGREVEQDDLDHANVVRPRSASTLKAKNNQRER